VGELEEVGGARGQARVKTCLPCLVCVEICGPQPEGCAGWFIQPCCEMDIVYLRVEVDLPFTDDYIPSGQGVSRYVALKAGGLLDRSTRLTKPSSHPVNVGVLQIGAGC
jgi:hypothetical protein